MTVSSFELMSLGIAVLSLLVSVLALGATWLNSQRMDRIEKAKAHAETHEEFLRHEADVQAARDGLRDFNVEVNLLRFSDGTLNGMSEYGRVVRQHLDEELVSLKTRPEEYRVKRARLAEQRRMAQRIASLFRECTQALRAAQEKWTAAGPERRTTAANEPKFAASEPQPEHKTRSDRKAQSGT